MKKNMIGAVLVLGFATSALAADTDSGKVTIKGKVSSSVAMSYHSGGAANVPAPDTRPDGSALDHVVNFDEVASTIASSDVIKEDTVVFRLRSNANYSLKASASLTSDAAAGDTDAVGLEDIGFGISEIAPSADPTLVAGDHSADGAGFPYGAIVAGGGVTYDKTLNDIAAEQVIATGARISKGGTASSAKNYITVATTYGILPQFFTPSSGFTAVVNFTITTP